MNILITGGAGSLGTALVNAIQLKEESQDTKFNIRVLDNNEHALAVMKTPYEVRKLYGSITDKDRVRRAVKDVDIVIHCAAMKNLEITEYNSSELIKTNVVGTDNIISSSVEAGVKKVMFISSDKAVEPSSIYGASKLIGEHTAINYNNTSKDTKISVFRSGNFIASNGNVFEVWKKEIENRLPLTITDIKCKRYFIPTQVAAETIIKCVMKMTGGEIFIPDDSIMKEKLIAKIAKDFYCKSMNPPIPLTKLNTTYVKFNIVGLRKGEKIFEILFDSYESTRKEHDHYLHCWVIK